MFFSVIHFQSFIFFCINDYNYLIFCRCWDEDPSIRPSFTEILQYFEKCIKERVSLNSKFHRKLIFGTKYTRMDQVKVVEDSL